VSLGLVGLVSLPVMAEVAKLTSLPLGKGSATITWVGNSGITPTINSIHGSAKGLTVKATGTVPPVLRLGQGQSGSTPSIPSSYPIADIRGTLAGTSFSLTITLKLSGLSFSPPTKPITFGSVSGSFHGQPITAVLVGRTAPSGVTFRGTIGNDHVTGTITRLVRHGKQSTAYATFDVTR
jgi:hypothetical protein